MAICQVRCRSAGLRKRASSERCSAPTSSPRQRQRRRRLLHQAARRSAAKPGVAPSRRRRSRGRPDSRDRPAPNGCRSAGAASSPRTGATSATMVAPAASQAGRPSGKRSSITHWVNGSVTTGQASSRPSAAATRARSASVVAGTMRSTMVSGQATSPRDEAPEVGDRAAARTASAAGAACAPLAGRLSQHSTVKARQPAGAAPASAAARNPSAERGASGWARSCTDVGMRLVELAGRRVVAIGLFGDGQADDARSPARAIASSSARRVLGRHQHARDAADDRQTLAPRRGSSSV